MLVHCPVCKKKTAWEENPWRPFCSERCKLVDLGKWASQDYTIPEDKDEAESKPETETNNT